MKVNTGTLLMVVACLASSSYLLSSWTTESQRSRTLAYQLKETTAQLLVKEEMASQCAVSEADLHTELVRDLAFQAQRSLAACRLAGQRASGVRAGPALLVTSPLQPRLSTGEAAQEGGGGGGGGCQGIHRGGIHRHHVQEYR